MVNPTAHDYCCACGYRFEIKALIPFIPVDKSTYRYVCADCAKRIGDARRKFNG